ncbi:type II toxin-antitoxin system RelE/ParE family toxin [Alphaproteobacteria bacterium]|jgi:phage-related protein|nr:type II toxin-antitoxin system RelE/ParE family toxin [Alphaproteobacteria bacterium]
MTDKKVLWVASSKDDLRKFPDSVKDVFGYALFLAQRSEKHPKTKRLKSIIPPVLEVCDDYDGDSYRAVYTVAIGNIVYVLHAFQKKSKKGVSTPKKDIAVIKSHLKAAERHHQNEAGNKG